jgi:hypothetical protein
VRVDREVRYEVEGEIRRTSDTNRQRCIMDEARFWTIVQQAHERSRGDMDEKCEALSEELSRLSSKEVRAFSKHFDAMMDRAYSQSLWGAAYLLHGGCGDDTFMDFRASLISRGRSSFEKALADPDSLADEEFDDDSWFYEGYEYVVMDAVQEHEEPGEAEDESGAGELPANVRPAGTPWTDDQLPILYPKLAQKYG